MKKHLKSGLLVGSLAVMVAAGVCIGQAMGMARPPQPHMEAALSYLQSARSELLMAEHNKAGHRVEALRLTDAAIAETRAGIEAAE